MENRNICAADIHIYVSPYKPFSSHTSLPLSQEVTTILTWCLSFPVMLLTFTVYVSINKDRILQVGRSP